MFTLRGATKYGTPCFIGILFIFWYFAGRKKRIAYASSLGINYINPKYKSRVKKYLLKFSHIGLREQSTIQLLSELLGRNDIVSVPDPTFLLTAKEWNEIAQKAVLEFDVPEKYMFVYFVGKRDSYTTTLETIRKKHGIKQIIIVPSFESGFFNIADALIYKNAGPAEFVKLLQNATVICTDSFHASAFSINLSKDFYVLKRFSDKDENSQNVRIYDLLLRYNFKIAFVMKPVRLIYPLIIHPYNHFLKKIEKTQKHI